ncbi:MAG: valine--tRNA ligase, partial [Elusimicrobiota bacterium]
YMTRLAKFSAWGLAQKAARPPQSAAAVVADLELFVPLEGLIDFGKEKQRLEKDLAALEADVARLDARLSNPDFAARAPAEEVDKTRLRREESAAKRTRLGDHLAALS